MSRNSLLEAGAKSEGKVTATGLEPRTTYQSPVAVTSPSDFAPASSKEFLDIQATIECRFTLKRVRDMTRTYSQMYHTDKYSEHSSIIWPLWPNG